MKKILVPTDFSTEAQYALDFARQFAKKVGAEISLLHVLEVPYGSFSVMGEVVTDYSFEHLYEAQLIQQTQRRLKELTAELEKGGIKADEKMIFGNPFIHIKENITAQKVDLVIQGSKGASGLSEIFIGSNAERVIRNAKCPVITVKGKSDLEDIKSMVLATDASAEQDLLVPKIKEFQSLLGLNLHLVRVRTVHNLLSVEDAKSQLSNFAERNKFENYTIGVLEAEFTDEGILDFALDNNIHMIGMGTHGRTGLAHFFGGSITEDVANHSHIPILSIPIPKS